VDHAFHVIGAGCGRLNFPIGRAEVSDTVDAKAPWLNQRMFKRIGPDLACLRG
jgi:hypothetical protein